MGDENRSFTLYNEARQITKGSCLNEFWRFDAQSVNSSIYEISDESTSLDFTTLSLNVGGTVCFRVATGTKCFQKLLETTIIDRAGNEQVRSGI